MAVKSSHPGGCSQAGRVSPGLALLAALIICGGVTYYFLRTAAPRGGTHDGTGDGGGQITATEGVGSRGAAAGGPGSDGRDPVVAAPARKDRADDTARPNDRRIYGSVTDDESAALAGVALRWVPVGRFDLLRYSHDSRALGKGADPSRVPAGRIREALSRSVLTSSAQDGTYELRVPLAGEPGVVVVSEPGYEMKISSANPENPDFPQAVAVLEDGPEGADSAVDPSKTGSKDDSSTDMQIHFRLGPASAISGKVTDSESGEVVAGMTVVAGVIDPEASAMTSVVNKDAPGSVVQQDGTYLLAGLKPGEYRVLPRTGDSDYAAFTTRQAAKVDLEAGLDVTDVDFEVTRGARIFGTITGPGDRAIEGAKCKVLPTDFVAASMRGDVEAITMFDSREDRSDSAGFYEIRGVPLGSKYRVAVEADDHAAAKSEVIEPVEESVEVNIALTVGSSISGHVLTADGDPARGAPVSVLPDFQKIMAGSFELAAEGLKAEADASGAFRLEHLAAGEYRLHPGKVKPQEMWGSQKGQVVEVDGIHDVTDVELVLPGVETGRIAGIVTDDEGRPIEEASIQVMKPEDFMGMSGTKLKTGVDGRFSASGLEGAIFRVGASKTGYASVKLNDVSIDNTGVEIILMRHGRVSGRVIPLEGVSLVAGGKVRARKVGSQSFLESLQNVMPGAPGGSQEIALQPDGAFTVEAPAGAIEILATVPMFAPAVSETITVSPGQELTGVEVLVTSGAVLLGRVTMAGREGIQGASVTVTPLDGGEASEMISEMLPQMFGKNRNQATTDGDGRFEVHHLAPGKYKVLAAHGDSAPSDPLEVSVARDQVREIGDLALTVGGVISGVARDGEAPKVGMMVQLMGGGSMKQGFTAADGTFEFRGLRPGEYMVTIMDLAAMQTGKAMMMKTRPARVEDEQVTDVEVIFGLGFKVHGKITGLPPAPIRMVTLRRPGGPSPEDLDPTDVQGTVAAGRYQAGMAMIAPDGQYEIADVEAGEYIIEVLRMPSDPTDMEAYTTMDRTPHYREEIQLEKEDLELNIVVK